MKRTPLARISPKRLALLQQEGGSLRRSTLAPGAGLERRTRVKPVNKARRAKRFARNFGAKRFWIVTLDCVIPGCWQTPVEAAHVKSRGAGGTSAHMVPLCALHHAEQHAIGIRTFGEAKYGLDLLAIAAKLEAEWQLRAPAALREHEAREREQEQIEGAA